MTLSIELEAMSLVLPTAKCELGITVTQQGIINSMGFVGVVVSSHFWGFMTDIWGRSKTLRLTLCLTIFLSILSSFSFTSWMLLITRLLIGIW